MQAYIVYKKSTTTNFTHTTQTIYEPLRLWNYNTGIHAENNMNTKNRTAINYVRQCELLPTWF